MLTSIILIALLIAVIIFCVIVIRQKQLPEAHEISDQGSYLLIFGKDATELFKALDTMWINNKSIHQAEASMKEGGQYISAATGFHKTLPFLFINISSLQNNYSNLSPILLIAEQCIDLSDLVLSGPSMTKDVKTEWALSEAHKIHCLLKNKKFI